MPSAGPISAACSRSRASRAYHWLANWASTPSSSGEIGVLEEGTAGGSRCSCEARSDGVVILIPAYRPNAALAAVVHAMADGPWEAIVVVDDGSGPGFASIFRDISKLPNARVVSHAINMGKGAALKTGINFILCEYARVSGVITVDADGQHDP